MTQWLIRHFITDADDINDRSVLLAYGRLSSMTGIACNILLFLVKLTIGMISGAIAVTGDAFNNLTDALSCLITLVGYRLAARPADRQHPFGHGRLEYIFSQIIVVMIFAVGGSLMYRSFLHVLNPTETAFHPAVFAVLLSTIAVKLWLSRFNRTLGRKTGSVAMMATAEDSRNDVLVTGIAAASMLLSGFFGGFPFDGIAGMMVAAFILWSGGQIGFDIISRMIGRPVDRQLSEQITALLTASPQILSVHDVIIHDYGTGVRMGSAHIEMDQNLRFVDAHDAADAAEKEILKETGVAMILHMDPVDLHDPQRVTYRRMIRDLLAAENKGYDLHDLRLRREGDTDVLIFDVTMPFADQDERESLQQKIDAALQKTGRSVRCEITFEHGYVEEEQA